MKKKAELVLTDAAGKNIISEIELPPEERTEMSALFSLRQKMRIKSATIIGWAARNSWIPCPENFERYLLSGGG